MLLLTDQRDPFLIAFERGCRLMLEWDYATHAAYYQNLMYGVMIDMPDETPATALTVTAEITVPLERITNSLIGAFEGGSTYWLRQIEYVDGPIKAENYDGPAYAEESFWHDGGRATLTYDNPEADESDDGDQTSMEIGLPELQKGLVAFALKCPSHFGDLISENDDAITHDCFVQYVIFGDVIYG